jgi:hypothetical protein
MWRMICHTRKATNLAMRKLEKTPVIQFAGVKDDVTPDTPKS